MPIKRGCLHSINPTPTGGRMVHRRKRFNMVQYLPMPSCRHWPDLQTKRPGQHWQQSHRPSPTLCCWPWPPPIRPRSMFWKGFRYLVVQANNPGVIVLLLSSSPPSYPIINFCPFFLPNILSLSFLLFSHYYPLVQEPITSPLDYHNCFPSGLSLSSLHASPLTQPK